jgi:hypothetical protein
MKTNGNEQSCETGSPSCSRVGPRPAPGASPTPPCILRAAMEQEAVGLKFPSRRIFALCVLLVLVLIWAICSWSCTPSTKTKFSAPKAETSSTTKSVPSVETNDDTIIIHLGKNP